MYYVLTCESGKNASMRYQFVTLTIICVVHATSMAICSCANGHIIWLLSGHISQNKCCLLLLSCFAHACALLVSLLSGIPFLLSFCLLQMARSGSQQKGFDFLSKRVQRQTAEQPGSPAVHGGTMVFSGSWASWINVRKHLVLACLQTWTGLRGKERTVGVTRNTGRKGTGAWGKGGLPLWPGARWLTEGREEAALPSAFLPCSGTDVAQFPLGSLNDLQLLSLNSQHLSSNHVGLDFSDISLEFVISSENHWQTLWSSMRSNPPNTHVAGQYASCCWLIFLPVQLHVLPTEEMWEWDGSHGFGRLSLVETSRAQWLRHLCAFVTMSVLVFVLLSAAVMKKLERWSAI